MEHVIELRARLLWALSVVVIAVAVSYLNKQAIYGFLVTPLADAMAQSGGTQRLIYTGLSEAFFTYIKVSVFAGVFVSFPMILCIRFGGSLHRGYINLSVSYLLAFYWRHQRFFCGRGGCVLSCYSKCLAFLFKFSV